MTPNGAKPAGLIHNDAGLTLSAAKANLQEAVELYLETWGGMKSSKPSKEIYLTSMEIAACVSAPLRLCVKSSHVSMEKRDGSDMLGKNILPMHREIRPGTLSDILNQTGLSKEELAELL